MRNRYLTILIKWANALPETQQYEYCCKFDILPEGLDYQAALNEYLNTLITVQLKRILQTVK